MKEEIHIEVWHKNGKIKKPLEFKGEIYVNGILKDTKGKWELITLKLEKENKK